MKTKPETIKFVADLARNLAEDGYNVYTIALGYMKSIHIENPDGLPLPAMVESITESEGYFHHHAKIGSTEIVWLTDKPKVAA